MTIMDNLEENITLATAHEVEEICKDFFNYTGITYFNFVRIYNDGSRISLCNNYGWQKFFIENHQNYSIIFEEKTQQAEANFLIWDVIDGITEDPLMSIARDTYDIDHGMTLITRYEDFTEF